MNLAKFSSVIAKVPVVVPIGMSIFPRKYSYWDHWVAISADHRRTTVSSTSRFDLTWSFKSCFRYWDINFELHDTINGSLIGFHNNEFDSFDMSHDEFNITHTICVIWINKSIGMVRKPNLASQSCPSAHSRGCGRRIASYCSFNLIYFRWTSFRLLSRFRDAFCSIQLFRFDLFQRQR